MIFYRMIFDQGKPMSKKKSIGYFSVKLIKLNYF